MENYHREINASYSESGVILKLEVSRSCSYLPFP